MNKKAKIGDIVMDNIVYLIFLIIFFVAMLAFVSSKMNGASYYEDYYAKEIVKIIESSEPGQSFAIDVSKASKVAQSNKVNALEEMFSFDNMENEVCVKLSRGGASCYSYFNAVNVGPSPPGNKWIYYAETSASVNRLHFTIFPKEVAE